MTPLFTSLREKKLWFWVIVVFAAIFSTLFIGQPLIEVFASQDLRAVVFLFGMILVAAAILIHAIKTKPSGIELGIIMGIVAVYAMFILRLGMPERSHLFEYSILAILIHKALLERANSRKLTMPPALLALIIAFSIGVLDEGVQIIIPDRVFDPEDIVFNGFVILMAIGTNIVFKWIGKIRSKSNRNKGIKNQ